MCDVYHALRFAPARSDVRGSRAFLRATPSSRYFNSSSVYASRQTMSSENDEKGDSSWRASSPSGAGGKRAVSQANGKFSFKDPETTEFVVKPSSGMR